MPSAPVIEFRSNVNPFPILSSFNYSQSKSGGGNLPVLHGEESNPVLFRIYNNFAASANIADAYNVNVTTYDGASSISHTAHVLPVSQSWMHILENGFGENSTPIADLYTKYSGTDTPIGGNANVYYAQKGSNGAYGVSQIRALGAGGVGYIEYKSYVQVPDDAPGDTYGFVITVNYEWNS